MDSDILEIVLYIVGAGIIPVVFSFVKKQLNEVKNEQVQTALFELTNATEDAVEAAMNTTVKQLRKNNEWNEQVAKRVKESVKKSALRSVGVSTSKVLNKHLGGDVAVDEKVGNLIERTVLRIKERRASK